MTYLQGLHCIIKVRRESFRSFQVKKKKHNGQALKRGIPSAATGTQKKSNSSVPSSLAKAEERLQELGRWLLKTNSEGLQRRRPEFVVWVQGTGMGLLNKTLTSRTDDCS